MGLSDPGPTEPIRRKALATPAAIARRLNTLRSGQSSVRSERNTARGGSSESALNQVEFEAMLMGRPRGAAAEELEGRDNGFAPRQMRP